MPTTELDLADARAVVLVEGVSDRQAVVAVARRLGRDLTAERVVVVATGGVTNIARYACLLGPLGSRLNVAGLYDAAEERVVVRGLERAGFGAALTRQRLEALGFFVCLADLEDELIRALGIERTERLVEGEGELAALRSLQRQPAQRDRPVTAQLHRFVGTKAGRKIRYAELFVDALDVDEVPAPLRRVLDRVA